MTDLHPTRTNEELHNRFPAHSEDTHLGIDNEGYLYARRVELDDPEVTAWRITECCGASATGMVGGAGCRVCYEYIDDAIALEPVL